MTDTQPDTSNVSNDMIGKIAAVDGQERLFTALTPSTAIGQILLLDYDTATLAVHDYHKERAGGLARGMFLLAGDAPANDDARFVLLRGGRSRTARKPHHDRRGSD